MLKSFLNTLNKYKMLTNGDCVIVGLSGGADSVLLLTLLVELREEYSLRITAAHINHGIRGEESDSDEEFARSYSRSLGVDFLSFHEDVPKAAEASGLSLETAGRDIRYNCFNKAMKSRGANKIAVAHNRNDNAETVLMNICRGTGLPGLCGIPPVRGPIIRPLIETGRAEIESYLSERHIPYCTDSTNFSDNITRNRVRIKLIPEIESVFGVDLCERLSSLSKLCSVDEDYINKSAYDAYGASLLFTRQKGISLSIPALRAYHPAVRARIFRIVLSEWGLKDITAYHIQAALSLIEAQSGKQAALPGGIVIKKYHNELCFSANEPENTQPFTYELKQDIPLYVPELSRYFLLTENQPSINSDAACTKVFQYDKINSIQIRSRQPGDLIRIRHIGSVKLKDYFINNKVPSYQRDSIGLAAQGGDVLWILDKKNMCHEQFEASDSVSRKIFLHVWE